MEQQTESPRLHALDGVRGLAIFLVFLNHIGQYYNFSGNNFWLRLLSDTIFSSGVIGVSLLFILSGFFMAYLYPKPSSVLGFLQKRYSRIFPLFLSMCTIMLFLLLFPHSSFITLTAIILILGFVVNRFWVRVVKKLPLSFGKSLFISFLVIQIAVGMFYAFWIMRHPQNYFFQEIPAFVRYGTIGLVNMTQTLPLGNYIPMLDGVYWSLGAEVLFYILYPIICAPVIGFVANKTKIFKFLLFLSLIPLFAGVYLISHKLFVLSMLQFQLFFYFATGMSLGYVFRKRTDLLQKWGDLFSGFLRPLPIILFFLTICLVHISNYYLDQSIPWTQMLFALPFTLLIALAVYHKGALAKLFEFRALVFLGIISYSVYLSHTPIIHSILENRHTYSILNDLPFILLTCLATVAFSSYLYIMLEKPYFMKRKTATLLEKNKPPSYVFSKKRVTYIFVSLCALYIIGVAYAYQSNYNFFSQQYGFDSNVFISPTAVNHKFISMKQYPVVDLQLKAQDNNFGVITMHLQRQLLGVQTLVFKIKELHATSWYATSTYNVSWIGNSFHHAFGFPTITDSKGKTYLVELSLANPDLPMYVNIDTSKNSVQGVYMINKSELFKHPIQLATFAENKITAAFLTLEARLALILLIPFLLTAALVLFI